MFWIYLEIIGAGLIFLGVPLPPSHYVSLLYFSYEINLIVCLTTYRINLLRKLERYFKRVHLKNEAPWRVRNRS